MNQKPSPEARWRAVKVTARGPSPVPSEVELQYGFEGDFRFDSAEIGRRFNWGKALGVAMVVGVSGAFWTGVGFLIAHFSR